MSPWFLAIILTCYGLIEIYWPHSTCKSASISLGHLHHALNRAGLRIPSSDIPLPQFLFCYPTTRGPSFLSFCTNRQATLLSFSLSHSSAPPQTPSPKYPLVLSEKQGWPGNRPPTVEGKWGTLSALDFAFWTLAPTYGAFTFPHKL